MVGGKGRGRNQEEGWGQAGWGSGHWVNYWQCVGFEPGCHTWNLGSLWANDFMSLNLFPRVESGEKDWSYFMGMLCGFSVGVGTSLTPSSPSINVGFGYH